MADVIPHAPSPSGLPFDDIRALVRMMPGPDEEAVAAAEARRLILSEPGRNEGLLARLPVFVAGWQGKLEPSFQRPLVAVFASAHGVASAAPVAVDGRVQLERLASGAAALNQVCATYDLGLKVFDLALDLPTPDIRGGDALQEDACAATMAFGMEAIAGGTDFLCLGIVGRGSDVAGEAILLALFPDLVETLPAPGPTAAAMAALRHHAGHLVDPLEVLRRLGGRDIAAAAGAILAARLQRIPVVLDGVAVTAAAAVLWALDQTALDHVLAGHVEASAVHRAVLGRIGLSPQLDMGLSAGDGLGAALASGLVKAAIARHNEGVPLA